MSRSRAPSVDRPAAVIRGHLGIQRAGSSGIDVTDLTTTVDSATEIEFTGATVTDNGDGSASVAIEAGLTTLTAITPTQLVANTDNWAPVDATTAATLDSATIVRASTDASRNLTGIVAPTSERTIFLENVGAFDLVLKHDATSTAANRFYCPGDSDLTLSKDSAVELEYDLTSARWRVIGAGSPASGAVVEVTDGVVSVDPATLLRVPPGGVDDDGSGQARLRYLTDRGGAQDAVDTISASGAAVTLDCAIANAFDVTLTANCTFTIANPPPAGVLGQIVVARRQGGVGSFLETWPASVKWQAADGTLTGSAPTLHTAVDAVNVALLTTVDGGVTWGATELPGAAALGDHTHATTGTGATGGGGTLTPATLDLPATTTPAQTAEGRVVWDSDDDKLTVGTGAGRKTMVNEGAVTTSGLTQATGKLLGRSTAATGAIEEITVGTGLSLAAGSLTATAGSSPLTTKGDLYGRSTVDARVPVGTYPAVLVPDPSATLGLRWATAVGIGGLLVEDGVTAPPVSLYSEDGTDWIYADV